ncbi:MAG: restriction endonuclease subunit S [Desulfuromonadaceae bacterium]|nr:restriction endonuclease subunit S [Desulfuromonadaceae bacterium]MDD2856697.1 restriction endonuclease subunit S [Desulfuromonadaceae bacterium]
MNRNLLLQHFDRISEAPDSIARLRRFILDLAVRGKLVEQDTSDEPAAELLKRIHAEKVRLVKEGKIKEQKELTKSTTEFPYKLPASWKWVPLGITVNSHLGGGTPSKNNSSYWDGDIFWASVKDIGKGKYVDETIDKISNAGLKDSSSNLIPPGNLIVVTRMGLGKISINRVPIAINQDLRALSLSSHSSIDYFYNFFKTHGYEGSGLTVKGIRVEELLNTNFPLPPLAEQHRIVAKVDELMALCDQLEAERNKREARRDRLAASSLNRISTTTAEEAKDATRFHLNHLPRLTTRAEHIKQLRQTILNLAVRGKLVEQDPSDEPAAELVKRIQLEKARLVKEGLERKGKAPILLKADEIPYSLPVSWKWSQFSEIGFISPRNVADNDLQASFVPMPMISAEYGIPNKHEVRSWGEIRSGFTHFAEGDVGLAKITPCFENRKSTIFRQLTGGIGAGTTELHIVRPIFVVAEYMLIFLKCPHFIETGIPKMTGTAGQKRVPTEYFTSSPFPLPPFAEQHRIVSKVDELMALCDQLEASLNTTEADNRRLLEAVLRDALGAGVVAQ